MAFIKVCGNLTKREIQVRISESGEKYVTFTLCDNPYKKNKEDDPYGEMVAYKVVCWGGFAELIQKEAMPGRQVIVKGVLAPHTWKMGDKEYRGVEIRATEVKVGRMPNYTQAK